MELTTNRGQTFDIQYVGTALTGSGRLLIEIEDDRLLSEIAADFEGVQTLRKADSVQDGVYAVYEGYTRLVSIHRNMSTDTVRLTLEKG